MSTIAEVIDYKGAEAIELRAGDYHLSHHLSEVT